MRCACGGIPGPDGECDACRQRRLARERVLDHEQGALGGRVQEQACALAELLSARHELAEDQSLGADESPQSQVAPIPASGSLAVARQGLPTAPPAPACSPGTLRVPGSVVDSVAAAVAAGCIDEAFWILNGRAMFELLGVLKALTSKSGYGDVRSNAGAKGGARMEAAVAAVDLQAKGGPDQRRGLARIDRQAWHRSTRPTRRHPAVPREVRRHQRSRPRHRLLVLQGSNQRRLRRCGNRREEVGDQDERRVRRVPRQAWRKGGQRCRELRRCLARQEGNQNLDRRADEFEWRRHRDPGRHVAMPSRFRYAE
jgi:hypothetical protein